MGSDYQMALAVLLSFNSAAVVTLPTVIFMRFISNPVLIR